MHLLNALTDGEVCSGGQVAESHKEITQLPGQQVIRFLYTTAPATRQALAESIKARRRRGPGFSWYGDRDQDFKVVTLSSTG